MTAESRTPQPLTDGQLAEIQARVDAATAGPWGKYEFGGGDLIEVAADLKETGHGYQARRVIARFDEEPLDNDPAHAEWTEEEDWAQVEADAEFTIHARADVPVLLAEVARLRSVVIAAVDRLHEMQRLEPVHARAASLYGVETQLRSAIGTETEAAP